MFPETLLSKRISGAEATSADQRFHASIDQLNLPDTGFSIIKVKFSPNITIYQIERIKRIAGDSFSLETLEAVLAVQMISQINPSDNQKVVRLTFDQCPIAERNLADFLKASQETGRLHNLAPDLKNPVIFVFDFANKQTSKNIPLLDIFVSFE